ncbi:hypothetical protein [Microbispora sp. NBC_01389]|uniref:hypothetical protein n=1 Tax=Microbispora sp. NBC_01389 TaxID=2903584 RepID=UPI00324F82D9
MYDNPVESQWDLLAPYGFHDSLQIDWIEGEDPEEIAVRMGLDPAPRASCDLGDAVAIARNFPLQDNIWIGRHSTGWVCALGMFGTVPYVDLGQGGRRFTLSHHTEYGFGGFMLWKGSEVAGEFGSDAVFDGELPALFERYGSGLGVPLSEPSRGFEIPGFPLGMETNDGSPGGRGLWPRDEGESLEVLLSIVGRIVGRFIDRAMLSETRTLYFNQEVI